MKKALLLPLLAPVSYAQVGFAQLVPTSPKATAARLTPGSAPTGPNAPATANSGGGPGPIGANPVFITYSGQATICAGDHLALTATGGNGTYTWSPNECLSATASATVVVGPLVTTTYTASSINPDTGARVVASVTITVQENCCPTSQNSSAIVNVAGSLFNTATGSPFAGYPAGTRFHLTGASPIVFSGITFNPPMGSVLLMDGGKDLYLQDGATLNLAGVSITAACDEMWGRLWVRNSAAGLRATYAEGTVGSITTPQFSDAIANDVLDQAAETMGIFLNGCQLLEIYGGHFQQNNDLYPDFSFSQRTKQVGIKASRVATLHDNFFSLLHTGIELHSVLYTNGTLFQAPLTTNTFTACRRAIEVHGGGTNRPSGTAAATADVALPIQCNTFDRGNGTRPGVAYGVYLDYDARVTFDPLPPATVAPQSNKFVNYGTSRIPLSGASYYALYNGSAVAAADVKYTTFNEVVDGVNGFTALGDMSFNVTLAKKDSYVEGQVCGYGNPGLERIAKNTSALAPNSPNPAIEATTFNYELANNSRHSELSIRNGTDGHEIQRLVLSPGSKSQHLSLSGWKAGIYFVTLYVDDAPVQTRRLLVK